MSVWNQFDIKECNPTHRLDTNTALISSTVRCSNLLCNPPQSNCSQNFCQLSQTDRFKQWLVKDPSIQHQRYCLMFMKIPQRSTIRWFWAAAHSSSSGSTPIKTLIAREIHVKESGNTVYRNRQIQFWAAARDSRYVLIIHWKKTEYSFSKIWLFVQ